MRTRTLLGAAAAVCLVAALVCFSEAWRSAAGPRHLVPFQPARVAVHAARTGLPLSNRPLSNRLPRQVPAVALASTSPPVRVTIPAVGLSARLVPVGLNRARQIDMPVPSVAGWYRPALPMQNLGAAGPLVLTGHVDTYKGPAVFYRLTGVRRGDKVEVVRANGSRSSFIISRVTVVRKTTFPSNAVFNPTTKPAIRLITCTGFFDVNTGHYVDSLIAWGKPAT
jgi:hypothetical protein